MDAAERTERMTEPPDDGELMVRLAVDDAATAQTAGVRFARDLTGARRGDFLLALAEQCDLICRAITDAGFSTDQAQDAAEHFKTSALVEWARIARAMTDDVSGTA